jgi:hypothetical protein
MTMKINVSFHMNTPRNSLPDKHYCEFHDSDYAKTNPDDVMKLFIH